MMFSPLFPLFQLLGNCGKPGCLNGERYSSLFQRLQLMISRLHCFCGLCTGKTPHGANKQGKTENKGQDKIGPTATSLARGWELLPTLPCLKYPIQL